MQQKKDNSPPSGKEFKKVQAALDSLGFFNTIRRTKFIKKSKKLYVYEIFINFKLFKTYKTRLSCRKYLYKFYKDTIKIKNSNG